MPNRKQAGPRSTATANPDKLVKGADIELTEDQLNVVAGGTSDIFAKLGDIKGESLDDKHKAQIEVLSIRRR